MTPLDRATKWMDRRQQKTEEYADEGKMKNRTDQTRLSTKSKPPRYAILLPSTEINNALTVS